MLFEGGVRGSVAEEAVSLRGGVCVREAVDCELVNRKKTSKAAHAQNAYRKRFGGEVLSGRILESAECLTELIEADSILFALSMTSFKSVASVISVEKPLSGSFKVFGMALPPF
ncbi:MAG: hypothetical protein EOM12_15135 [Verrucomicrobiae bacterium]|nr:hypothetical protein [Verrucomicrobiae bacterium]